MLGKSAHNPPKSGRMPRRCPDGDLRPPAEWETKKAAPAARSGQKGPEGAAGAAADAPGARGTRPAGAVLPEKSVRGTARRLPGAQLPASAGQTFQQLHKAEGERRKEVRTSLSRILLLLKEHCVQHAQAPSEQELRDAERIKQMVDFIRFHQAEPLTTAQIASSAAISVSECLRCFRRVMDRTPKEYLRQHRIRHAVSLLEQTDQSIARIGAACGFDDMSYFARIFRAERGCTPSEYREKLRK